MMPVRSIYLSLTVCNKSEIILLPNSGITLKLKITLLMMPPAVSVQEALEEAMDKRTWILVGEQ